MGQKDRASPLRLPIYACATREPGLACLCDMRWHTIFFRLFLDSHPMLKELNPLNERWSRMNP